MSSSNSIIINGGRESSSHDFKITEVKTERRSVSRILRKPSMTDVVVENFGGRGSSAYQENPRQ